MEQQLNEAVGKISTGGKRVKKGGHMGMVIAGALAAAAAVVCYGACCTLAHTSGTFFPHTEINSVNVSGLTVDEAFQRVSTQMLGRKVVLTLEDEDAPLATTSMRNLLADDPVDSADFSAVYESQHSGLFSGGWKYLKGLFSKNSSASAYLWDDEGVDAWVEEVRQQVDQDPADAYAEIRDGQVWVTTAQDGRKLDTDALREQLSSLTELSGEDSYELALTLESSSAKTLTAQEVYDQLHSEMKNASYDPETGSIVPEQPGAAFDTAAAQKLLDATPPGETVSLDADIQEPDITAAELERVLFRDVLGEAKTKVGGTAARKSNVKLSAASINGYVMNSGDVFSYNGVVGQRTAANGYQAAPAYVQGETVNEIGGGICQTSSTLYLACLRSNVEITERYAHRYAPSYIPWGMDATVSWGGPDYKFTNNTDYPIKIVTTYADGYLTVKLLGTNLDGSYSKITNETLSTTPWETVYQEDSSVASGNQVVKTTPYTGYQVKTYHTVYDKNGNVIDSHFEASSSYKSRNKVVLVAPGELPGSKPAGTTSTGTPSAPSSSETETSKPSSETSTAVPGNSEETADASGGTQTGGETSEAPPEEENPSIIVIPDLTVDSTEATEAAP